ncbi:MAG: RHS repeat-associated core domain-containing protein [Gemmatimonadales bacterium]
MRHPIGGWSADECWYDAEGRTFNPCDEAAPHLSFDGDNASRTGGGSWWRYFHAPGLDDPILMIYRSGCCFVSRELYMMTDGSGRQLAVGDSIGHIDTDDLQTTGRTEWRYGGQTSNAQGFGAERYQAPSIDGVSYFRNRAYDTRTGRWTQEDPIGVAGGVNLYQYAGNDPVGFTDPFGLCTKNDPNCRFGQRAFSAFKATVNNAANSALSTAAAAGEWIKKAGKWLAKEAAIQGALALTTEGGGNAIRITEGALAHIAEGHMVGGALTKGKSVFNAGEDIIGLVRGAENAAATAQAGGNLQRIMDAGRIIGIDRATGAGTSVYSVITSPGGRLITMFPGTP